MIRTSCVLGKYGKSLVYTMLPLAEDHDKLTVVEFNLDADLSRVYDLSGG